MFKYAQDDRWLRIDTPLGEDVLLVAALRGREEISGLFHFTLDLLSESDAIDPTKIVGSNVTVSVHNLDDSLRYFNGFVRQFSYCGTEDRLSRYRAEIVPWLWFATRTTDCRIFQNRSVPEIIGQVFGDLGFSGFETSEIKGTHPKREYCVQYRESDFDFVSRLMEEEGIFYFFRHEDGQHVMVMADHAGAYMTATDGEVRMVSTMGSEQLGDDITAWEHRHEYRSGKCAHTDYNFKTPSTDLAAAAGTVMHLQDAGRYELFDYPGRYQVKAEGDQLARLRMEEQEVPHDTVIGAGRCRSFCAGARFKLAAHPSRNEAGRSYAIISIEHTASQRGAFTSGGDAAEDVYTNSFTCIRDDAPFRPARSTPRPLVRGAQTAQVVGPSGEEIYTDEFGRVKVQFHWDREGQRDENSSCWIRVAQPWAGKRWGVFFLPRIGQEVVVEFLEGDPDRPLITGSVYNAEQMPPYELPEHKTRSAIKTLSSKGGEGWNEIRFEDRKDQEQIFVHAERDQDTRVKHDSREWVGNERHLIVGDGEEGTGNQSELVHGNKDLTVKKDHIEQIEGDMTLTIGNGEGAGGNVNIVIEQDKHELIKKNSNLHVKADRTELIDGMHGTTVKGDDVRYVGGNSTISASGVIQLQCKTLVISASSGMSIRGPGGFVDVGAGGVTIQGTVVKINSGGSAKDTFNPPKITTTDAGSTAPATPAVAADDRPGLVSSPEPPGPGPPAADSRSLASPPAAARPAPARTSARSAAPASTNPLYSAPVAAQPLAPAAEATKPCRIRQLDVNCKHGRKPGPSGVLQVVAGGTSVKTYALGDDGGEFTGLDVEGKKTYGGKETITGVVKTEAAGGRTQLSLNGPSATAADSEWKSGPRKDFDITGPAPLKTFPMNAMPEEHRLQGRGCDDITQAVTVESFPNQYYEITVGLKFFTKWANAINKAWEDWGSKVFAVSPVALKPSIDPPRGTLSAEWGWQEDKDWRAYFNMAVSANLDPIIGISIEIEVSALKLLGAAFGIPAAITELGSDHLADILLTGGAGAQASLKGSPSAKFYATGEDSVTGEATLSGKGSVSVKLTARVGSKYIVQCSFSGEARMELSPQGKLALNREGLFLSSKGELDPLTLAYVIETRTFYFFSSKKEDYWKVWDAITIWESGPTKVLPR